MEKSSKKEPKEGREKRPRKVKLDPIQEEPVQDSMDELLQDPIEEQENRERPNREAQLLEEADTIISEPSAVLISTLLKMPKVLMSLVLI